MSEEDLEVLITVDDPGEDTLEEDTFNHSQAGDTAAHRAGQPYSTRRRRDPEVIVDDPS